MKQGQRKQGKGLIPFLVAIVVVVALDQVSKLWIEQHFSILESRTIIPGLFNLTFLTNNGAAFSLLAGEAALWRQIFFILIAVLALVLLAIAQRSYGPYGRLYSIGLGLIAGGAAGNLIDRLRLGYVIDFFDFYIGTAHWPAFNVADAAICAGVFLFLVKNLLIDRGRVGGADEHGARQQA